MQQPIWNNLTPAFRREIEVRNSLTLAKLTPSVVTYQVPNRQLAIDWEHVILLKYCPGGSSRRGATIIWNAHVGFVSTDVSPITLIDRLEQVSPVTWQDMQAYTDISQGRRPLSYVLGPLHEQKKSQYSWLNGRYVQTINPMTLLLQEKQAMVALKPGPEVLVQDSAERLTGKWKLTNKIRRLQQINREYINELYGSHYLVNVQVPPELLKFRRRVQYLTVLYLEKRLPVSWTADEMNEIVDAARHNASWPLDDLGPLEED